jgi:two-component system, cell cycle sensor histidine kinase and response regulator CckA
VSAVGHLKSALLRWWSAPVSHDPVVVWRGHRRRLRQELLVRASVASLMLVFNEVEHGVALIRVVALAALALNVPYFLTARTRWLARPQAYTRLVMDVILTTLGLYGAGGLLAASFISIYMVTPIYAAFALSGGACLLAAGLATGSFLLTAVLQQTFDPGAAAIPATAWPIAIFNLLLLNVVAGLTALLAAAYRHSQRRLVESEECFRSIAISATDAILVTDGGGSVVMSNPAAETMFGYSHADMLHTPLPRLVLPPGPGRGHAEPELDSILTQGVNPVELAGLRKDGAQFPVELRVAPWTTRSGTFFTCIVRDVTSRKQIEELARENAEVVRAVVQSSPVAVWAHRFDGGLTIWNPAAERMFGWTANEVLGKYPPFVPEERLSESHAIFERALAGAELMNVEVRRRRKDGSDIDINLSSAPLRNALGGVTGIVTVALDITERKHLEAQNRQLQKMDTLGSLAGGIAHDFNNLLSVITGRSHMLGRSLEADNALRRHLDLINETAAQAAALTQQLLAFSRKQAFSLSVVKLTEIVEGLERILRRLIGEDVELFITHGPNVGWVKADRGQLEQVILNLVVNAREAMPSGGMINVEIADAPADTVAPGPSTGESSGPYARLTVSDTGVGMDEATRLRIFEPFFTTKAVGKGTGLGLSTVYGIVNQHGGWIRVDSAPNRGTTFEVYLPRVEEPVSTSPATRPVPTIRRGSETILLVEDDAQVRTLAREILEEGGYTVLEAALPTKALQIASQTRVELVLTDVIMPQMRGPALAERLNRLQPHAKMLLMSGYPDDPNTKNVARDFTVLKKPLTPDGLLHGVRTALDRGPRRRSRRRRGAVARGSNLGTET